MKYIAPHPGSGRGPNDEYIDGNPAESIIGSIPPAAAIEHPMREIMAVIESEPSITPSENTLTQLLEAINFKVGNAVTGTGMIGMFAGSTAPSGWLIADGSEVSKNTYDRLYNVILDVYGTPVDNDNFILPDLRGEFMRGLDNGRGIDAARTLGAPQLDALQNMTGGWQGDHQGNDPTEGGVVSSTLNSAGPDGLGSGRWYTFDASLQVRTADETRPRNVALLACIKT